MKLEDFNALKIQMQIDEHDIRSFFKRMQISHNSLQSLI